MVKFLKYEFFREDGHYYDDKDHAGALTGE